MTVEDRELRDGAKAFQVWLERELEKVKQEQFMTAEVEATVGA